jgi:hypothetical protein
MNWSLWTYVPKGEDFFVFIYNTRRDFLVYDLVESGIEIKKGTSGPKH